VESVLPSVIEAVVVDAGWREFTQYERLSWTRCVVLPCPVIWLGYKGLGPEPSGLVTWKFNFDTTYYSMQYVFLKCLFIASHTKLDHKSFCWRSVDLDSQNVTTSLIIWPDPAVYSRQHKSHTVYRDWSSIFHSTHNRSFRTRTQWRRSGQYLLTLYYYTTSAGSCAQMSTMCPQNYKHDAIQYA